MYLYICMCDTWDILIVDPWTWAGKGWIVNPCLKGHDKKVYMLDFFGYHQLPNQSLRVPDNRILTAYGGSPQNTFLGYYLDVSSYVNISQAKHIKKKNQGIIWGKDVRHYEGEVKLKMLKAVADVVPLVSSASAAVFQHPNIRWIGHQTRKQWNQLLLESKFMIGLGDPLLGPSAIDAISHGCVYINPKYHTPVRHHFYSQHPYAMNNIGSPYVCSTFMDDLPSVISCVKQSLTMDLSPIALEDFKEEVYIQRVKKIFNL